MRLTYFCLLLGMSVLSGCTTYEYHETTKVSASRFDSSQGVELPEDELLDVGIVLFDTGIDLLDEDSAAYSNVRQSEAVWFASQLKAAMEDSNVWAAIRTMPSANSVMDLQIEGKIIESNGEFVKLQISAHDATGKIWFSKEYKQRASSYAYNPEVNSNRDPFHSLFVRVANDLFDHRATLSSEELIAIRTISKVRFANDFLPDQYSDYVLEKKNRYTLQRAPAANDPMIVRIDRIRARNDLFLDVVQDYYRVFNGNMAHPYQEWRKTSYKEVLYERQLKQQAKKEKLAGVAALVVGVLAAQGSSSNYTRAAGHVGIFAGAEMIWRGYQKQNESMIHSSTLRELGASLEAELEPSVIDLQERSITLSGTVDDQFQEWRRILGEMFAAENGLERAILEIDGSAIQNQISAEADGQELPSDPLLE